MEYQTSFLEEKLLVCEDVDDLRQDILPKLTSQQNMWKEKINSIIADSGLNKAEFARRCGVSRMAVNKWTAGSIPRNRETYIRIGLLVGYDLDSMNVLLTRYGRYPKLYSKTLEDCVCMYVLNRKRDDRLSVYDSLLNDIRSAMRETSGSTERVYQTVLFDRQLEELECDDELSKFVQENVDVFKSAYNGLYEYVKSYITTNSQDALGIEQFSVNFLANEQGWSSSLRHCVSAISQGTWYPTRNKIISLGMHLNMDYEQVNEMLSLAHMEALCPKNPFESVIIYILIDAKLNDLVETDGSDSLCLYAREILSQFDMPEIEGFLAELPEQEDF